MQQIKKKMPHLMDEMGLTDDSLIGDYLVPLLNATQVKAFNHEGKVIYAEPQPALDIRLGALREAFKLKGSYAPPPDASQSYSGIRVINMEGIPRPNREKFLEAERELKALEAQKNGHKNGNEPEE